MTLLSICMPSHRDLENSRRSIETALAFCEARDAVLVLSDNSGDARKRAYWQGRSPRLSYIVNKDEDANANFLSSIDSATTPFVLNMGDDDEIYHDPAVAPFDLASLPDDHIGVRPLTEVWIPGSGVVRVKDFAIAEDDPGNRLLEYNQKAGGDNSAFYSIFRRKHYAALMSLFLRHHPTKGGYCDWAQVMAMFAYGKMAYDPGTIFRYNFEQWAVRDVAEARTRHLYEAAGLPADGEKFHLLLLFLDLFVFLSRPSTPLNRQQALRALSVTAGTLFNGFLHLVQQNPDDYDETMRYLVDMALQEFNSLSRFHIALIMADAIQPGMKDRYVAFYKAAMAD